MLLTRADPKSDGFQSEHEPGTPKHSIDWIRGQLGEIEKLTSILFVSLFLTILAYAAACLKGWEFDRALLVLALCSVVAVLGTVSGGALGFLFGIPRLPRQIETAASDRRATGTDAPQRSTVAPYIVSNSNLEEISDWLTKIIVGLGLIHLSNIPSYIGNYRGWLERAVAMSGGPASLSWFLLVVTFAAAFIGFLFFYVQTRTRMAVLFQETEAVRDSRISKEDVQRARGGTQFTTTDGKPLEEARKPTEIKSAQQLDEDKPVLSQMPQPTDSSDRWGAWAAANARAGNFDSATFGWQMAIQRDSGANRSKTAELHEKYAEVLQALERNVEALRHYEKAREHGADELSILTRELLVALYVPPVDGFTYALKTAKSIETKYPEAVRRNPWIRVWRLAALGQQHRWLMARGKEQDAARVVQEIKVLVEELVRDCADPNDPIRRFMRQMIDPETYKGESEDDDLISLRKVDEVYKLIVKDAPPP